MQEYWESAAHSFSFMCSVFADVKTYVRIHMVRKGATVGSTYIRMYIKNSSYAVQIVKCHSCNKQVYGMYVHTYIHTYIHIYTMHVYV